MNTNVRNLPRASVNVLAASALLENLQAGQVVQPAEIKPLLDAVKTALHTALRDLGQDRDPAEVPR